MTETQGEMGKPSLGHLEIGNWDLFGAWDLEFGI
jgi:hypothetical protein